MLVFAVVNRNRTSEFLASSRRWVRIYYILFNCCIDGISKSHLRAYFTLPGALPLRLRLLFAVGIGCRPVRRRLPLVLLALP